jgi:erythromycin esterase-like protein
MDIQGISQSDFRAVEDYIDQIDPPQAASIRMVYAGIANSGMYPGSSWQHYYAYTQALRVYNQLKANQPIYERRSSPQAFALALQNARIIAQFTFYLKTNSPRESLARFVQRDAFMAENVSWIHDHVAGDHPKMIVWAHDGHIASNASYYAGFAPAGTNNMGGLLRKWYQQSYFPIATSLYQGVYTIYLHSYQRVTTAQVNAPDRDTYNYTLGNVGMPLYLLDLRQTPPGPVTDWANGSHVFLLPGLGGEDLSLPCRLKQWFDVVIHIQNTTASRSLL